jgi:hypothetical protein
MFQSRLLRTTLTCGILTGCTLDPPPPIRHGIATQRDSVIEAGIAIYRLVRMVDQYARASGELPSSLAPVIAADRYVSDTDIWGERLSYVPDGPRFRIRSAGPDRTLYTADDVVATGQMGRDRPCELVNQYRRLTYEDVAPRCEDTPLLVLPRCRIAEDLDLTPPLAQGDLVVATGEWLIRIARRVDAVGRSMGGLPPSLLPVWNPDDLVDYWGERLSYTPSGDRFEIRSKGPDRLEGTDDDITVAARLGHPVLCEFTYRGTMRACIDPVPQCPERTSSHPETLNSLS